MMIPTLKTLELTRRIREQHAEQLKTLSPAERIAYYRQQAQALHMRLHLPAPETVVRVGVAKPN